MPKFEKGNQWAYKPGQSGNPNGRPPGAHSLEAEIYRELGTMGIAVLAERIAKRLMEPNFIEANPRIFSDWMKRLWPERQITQLELPVQDLEQARAAVDELLERRASGTEGEAPEPKLNGSGGSRSGPDG